MTFLGNATVRLISKEVILSVRILIAKRYFIYSRTSRPHILGPRFCARGDNLLLLASNSRTVGVVYVLHTCSTTTG